MKNIFISKLTNYLNNWLELNDFNCTSAFGNEFSYDYTKDLITYTFIVSDIFNSEYIKICKTLRPELITIDPFIISFFHELGHFKTQDLFSDTKWKDYERLCRKLKGKDRLTLSDYKKYWSNPIELEATKWACDYIVDNSDIVNTWWNSVQSLILEFYNSLEGKNFNASSEIIS